jgi:hypothetical protein
MAPRPDAGEAGSAVVEFSLVGALTVVLFLGVVQLGIAMHVRTTLVAAAAAGARYGANANRGPADAVRRTRELVGSALSPAYPVVVSASYETRDGVAALVVRVQAPFPVVGLAGPRGDLAVDAGAWAEPR